MLSFKYKHSFQERFEEAHRVINKYPDRVPLICEKSYSRNHNLLPDIDKNKYLVPFDLTVGQFMYVIRKRMSLRSEEAIFLFVSNVVPPSSSLIGHIYQQHKDPDGFLYVQYSKENVFGSF
jgi:GABA(A) receptor-associated protein